MGIIYGNTVGVSGVGVGKTLELIDEAGFSLIGTIVDEVIKFDATPNDVRKGKTFCCDSGSLVGEKDIPAYHTTVGMRLIPAGSRFLITLKDRWDYTKLQCIIAPFSEDGIAADKIVMDDFVYEMGSMIVVSAVTKNEITNSIELNITNNSDQPYYIYYFTYK